MTATKARALAHFSLRTAVHCKQKAKVTIKFSVSPDTAPKRHEGRHSSRAEPPEAELNCFCTVSAVVEASQAV